MLVDLQIRGFNVQNFSLDFKITYNKNTELYSEEYTENLFIRLSLRVKIVFKNSCLLTECPCISEVSETYAHFLNNL